MTTLSCSGNSRRSVVVLEGGTLVVVSLVVVEVVIFTLVVLDETRVDTVALVVDVDGSGSVSVGSQ